MKLFKMLLGVAVLFAIIAGSGLLQPAWTADNISVTNIEPVYVEKGSTNYTITVRAIVENNGEGDDVVIDVAAIDSNGFQLKTLKLSGFIDEGKKKVLIGRMNMEKSAYEQIVKWEWLK